MNIPVAKSLLPAACLFVLMGCINEEAEKKGTPQFSHVTFTVESFSDEPLSSESRTRGDKVESPLKGFTRLDVVFFAADNTPHAFHQTSSDTNFGTLSFELPYDDYTIVAVAHKCPSGSDLVINSPDVVQFPNKKVTNMAMKRQQVRLNAANTSVSVELDRNVAAFKMKCTDDKPSIVKTITTEIKGDCGDSFNPATGFAVDNQGVSSTITAEEKVVTQFFVTTYAFLKSRPAEVTIVVTARDALGNTLREHTFDNVKMTPGYRTVYTGKFFSASSEAMFTVSTSDLQENEENNKTF